MMKTFAQILNGRVHYVFEALEKPNYASNITLVDITNVSPAPQAEWLYDSEIHTFTESTMPKYVEAVKEPTPEEIQAQTLLNTEYLVIMSELSTL